MIGEFMPNVPPWRKRMGLHWGRAVKAVPVGVTSQFFSSSIIPATSGGKRMSVLGLWEVENDLTVCKACWR